MNLHFKNILIADDHPIVRQGVEMMLSSRLGNAKFYYARSINETLASLGQIDFDLLFLDLYFPDGNSMEIIHQIREKCPSLKIIVFSGMEDEVYALPVYKAGADGYINKLGSPEFLENAIDKVLLGKPCFNESLIAKLEQSKAANPLSLLSERELEIVKLLFEDKGNLEICNILSLQKSTVSTFIKRIKEKLNVDSVSLVAKLYETYRHTI